MMRNPDPDRLTYVPVEESVKADKNDRVQDILTRISGDDSQLFKLVALSQANVVGKAQIFREARVGVAKGNRQLRRFVEIGLIDLKAMTTDKPGRNPTVPVLTGLGRQVAERLGIGPDKLKSLHREVQEAIAAEHRKDPDVARVEIESRLYGSRIDVRVERQDGSFDAFEVALSPHHQAENVRVDLRAGASWIWMLCRNQQVRDAIRKDMDSTLFAEEISRVKFGYISDYLKGK